VSMSLPLFSGEFELNLKTIIDTLRLLGIPTGQYIYLRAELHTVKDFGADSVFALRRFDYQYSYTNPIWMKADNPVGFKQSNIRLDDIRIFPNPAKSVIHIQNPPPANLPFSINTLQGEIVASGIATNTIDISNLPDGMYIICFGDKLNTKYQKFVKASSE
ncbi:MAG: T9SS type A sorting domain-containing protein, partial [Bacteroidetes bacterium]|nr:T9SS type A sorting domain-containing protein [Bacteroidota bacterium]